MAELTIKPPVPRIRLFTLPDNHLANYQPYASLNRRIAPPHGLTGNQYGWSSGHLTEYVTPTLELSIGPSMFEDFSIKKVTNGVSRWEATIKLDADFDNNKDNIDIIEAAIKKGAFALCYFAKSDEDTASLDEIMGWGATNRVSSTGAFTSEPAAWTRRGMVGPVKTKINKEQNKTIGLTIIGQSSIQWLADVKHLKYGDGENENWKPAEGATGAGGTARALKFLAMASSLFRENCEFDPDPSNDNDTERRPTQIGRMLMYPRITQAAWNRIKDDPNPRDLYLKPGPGAMVLKSLMDLCAQADCFIYDAGIDVVIDTATQSGMTLGTDILATTDAEYGRPKRNQFYVHHKDTVNDFPYVLNITRSFLQEQGSISGINMSAIGTQEDWGVISGKAIPSRAPHATVDPDRDDTTDDDTEDDNEAKPVPDIGKPAKTAIMQEQAFEEATKDIISQKGAAVIQTEAGDLIGDTIKLGLNYNLDLFGLGENKPGYLANQLLYEWAAETQGDTDTYAYTPGFSPIANIIPGAGFKPAHTPEIVQQATDLDRRVTRLEEVELDRSTAIEATGAAPSGTTPTRPGTVITSLDDVETIFGAGYVPTAMCIKNGITFFLASDRHLRAADLTGTSPTRHTDQDIALKNPGSQTPLTGYTPSGCSSWDNNILVGLQQSRSGTIWYLNSDGDLIRAISGWGQSVNSMATGRNYFFGYYYDGRTAGLGSASIAAPHGGGLEMSFQSSVSYTYSGNFMASDGNTVWVSQHDGTNYKIVAYDFHNLTTTPYAASRVSADDVPDATGPDYILDGYHYDGYLFVLKRKYDSDLSRNVYYVVRYPTPARQRNAGQNPPLFPRQNYFFSVRQGSAAGTVVGTVTAEGASSYAKSAGSSALFNVNSTTGQITLASALQTTTAGYYTIGVNATNASGTANTAVHISVESVIAANLTGPVYGVTGASDQALVATTRESTPTTAYWYRRASVTNNSFHIDALTTATQYEITSGGNSFILSAGFLLDATGHMWIPRYVRGSNPNYESILVGRRRYGATSLYRTLGLPYSYIPSRGGDRVSGRIVPYTNPNNSRALDSYGLSYILGDEVAAVVYTRYGWSVFKFSRSTYINRDNWRGTTRNPSDLDSIRYQWDYPDISNGTLIQRNVPLDTGTTIQPPHYIASDNLHRHTYTPWMATDFSSVIWAYTAKNTIRGFDFRALLRSSTPKWKHLPEYDVITPGFDPNAGGYYHNGELTIFERNLNTITLAIEAPWLNIRRETIYTPGPISSSQTLQWSNRYWNTDTQRYEYLYDKNSSAAKNRSRTFSISLTSQRQPQNTPGGSITLRKTGAQGTLRDVQSNVYSITFDADLAVGSYSGTYIGSARPVRGLHATTDETRNWFYRVIDSSGADAKATPPVVSPSKQKATAYAGDTGAKEIARFMVSVPGETNPRVVAELGSGVSTTLWSVDAVASNGIVKLYQTWDTAQTGLDDSYDITVNFHTERTGKTNSDDVSASVAVTVNSGTSTAPTGRYFSPRANPAWGVATSRNVVVGTTDTESLTNAFTTAAGYSITSWQVRAKTGSTSLVSVTIDDDEFHMRYLAVGDAVVELRGWDGRSWSPFEELDIHIEAAASTTTDTGWWVKRSGQTNAVPLTTISENVAEGSARARLNPNDEFYFAYEQSANRTINDGNASVLSYQGNTGALVTETDGIHSFSTASGTKRGVRIKMYSVGTNIDYEAQRQAQFRVSASVPVYTTGGVTYPYYADSFYVTYNITNVNEPPEWVSNWMYNNLGADGKLHLPASSGPHNQATAGWVIDDGANNAQLTLRIAITPGTSGLSATWTRDTSTGAALGAGTLALTAGSTQGESTMQLSWTDGAGVSTVRNVTVVIGAATRIQPTLTYTTAAPNYTIDENTAIGTELGRINLYVNSTNLRAVFGALSLDVMGDASAFLGARVVGTPGDANTATRIRTTYVVSIYIKAGLDFETFGSTPKNFSLTSTTAGSPNTLPASTSLAGTLSVTDVEELVRGNSVALPPHTFTITKAMARRTNPAALPTFTVDQSAYFVIDDPNEARPVTYSHDWVRLDRSILPNDPGLFTITPVSGSDNIILTPRKAYTSRDSDPRWNRQYQVHAEQQGGVQATKTALITIQPYSPRGLTSTYHSPSSQVSSQGRAYIDATSTSTPMDISAVITNRDGRPIQVGYGSSYATTWSDALATYAVSQNASGDWIVTATRQGTYTPSTETSTSNVPIRIRTTDTAAESEVYSNWILEVTRPSS